MMRSSNLVLWITSITYATAMLSCLSPFCTKVVDHEWRKAMHKALEHLKPDLTKVRECDDKTGHRCCQIVYQGPATAAIVKYFPTPWRQGINLKYENRDAMYVQATEPHRELDIQCRIWYGDEEDERFQYDDWMRMNCKYPPGATRRDRTQRVGSKILFDHVGYCGSGDFTLADPSGSSSSEARQIKNKNEYSPSISHAAVFLMPVFHSMSCTDH